MQTPNSGRIDEARVREGVEMMIGLLDKNDEFARSFHSIAVALVVTFFGCLIQFKIKSYITLYSYTFYSVHH